MDKSILNLWVNDGRKRDDNFIRLFLEQVKCNRNYLETVTTFGEPDEIRKQATGNECFYFYKAEEKAKIYDMFVYLAVVEGMIVDYCANEKKHLW